MGNSIFVIHSAFTISSDEPSAVELKTTFDKGSFFMYSLYMGESAHNPQKQISRPIGAVVVAHKKLIVALAFAFLSVLLLLIVLANTPQKSNIAPQTTTFTKPEESNVNLKSEYENPFSSDTQYVNPFSDYKNPFDNLE